MFCKASQSGNLGLRGWFGTRPASIMRHCFNTVPTMLVLGLETSCDETGVALYDTERGLLSHALFSQVDVHVEYGGVVPELASRDHVRKTLAIGGAGIAGGRAVWPQT